jgi:CRP/FNR family cyclic AMP-dependent transcriptional regulator
MTRQFDFDPTDEQASSQRMARLAALEPVRIAGRGTTFIEEGAQECSLIYIVSGTVRTYVGKGERELTFGTYGPGESFGELTLHGGPRNTSIEAITDTEYTLVPLNRVLNYIAEYPEFALDLLKRATTRARVTTARARSLALQDSYGRLASLIGDLALAEGKGENQAHGLVEIRITHQDIAHRIGCSREMVTRLLRDLETGGFVATTRGKIRLLKPLPDAW